jgi:uncharacterized membrane protein (DUF4010 family)
MNGEDKMDIIQIVLENSQIILLVISIILALVAKYFQNQAKAVAEVVQALTDLSQEILSDVKDGAVSPDELNAIVAKIVAANTAIQNLIDMLKAPQTLTQKFVSVFSGYKPETVALIKYKIKNVKIK